MDIRKITKKIKKGKLLRVEYTKNKNRIDHIKITGDFFIYPEKAIYHIEQIILESNLNELECKLNQYINKNKIKLIGFKVSDLVDIFKATNNKPKVFNN
ncbi:MAG: Lipoate-protein ligase A subunit 2 [Candidatus Woesearchaeota archaeon]|nr:Lipoate-protein ligase A subunit 2 [Candidatus Woesearchaeota archaeon]